MPSVNIIQQHIEDLLFIFKQYIPLINSHMVDYFTKDAYVTCIPPVMRNEIENIGYDHLIESIFCNKLKLNTPYLYDFLKITKDASLYNKKDVCLNLTELHKQLVDLGCKNETGIRLKVFVKPKKSHEVEILSSVIASLRNISNITHLVDIGDGKGYLSSLLSFHYKIPVLGIDASVINTTGAIKRAEKLGKRWHGIISSNKSVLSESEIKHTKSNNLLYKQITQFVTEDTNFKELVSNVFMEKISGLGVVGLHTCGNLAPAALRIFAQNEDVKILCNVSCCYHLLSEKNFDSEQHYGFPMSKFLIEKNCLLGRTARMLSAQSSDRILNKKELPNKNIFYRAIFEVFLNDYYPEYTSRNVGKLKTSNVSFAVYVKRALQKLNLDINVGEYELNKFYDKFLCREKELYTFNLLRCMIAPLIESIILLDRLLYLHEEGYTNSYLVQLFDPVISPRCYGVISHKGL